MSHPPPLNSVARTRWRRFRRLRRAWVSLCLLTGLYALSLFAELLCNDKPLIVRFRGHWFCPVLQYVPESRFVDNGRSTRPDYKAIAATSAFAPGSGNWMLFPPHSWGPNAILQPAALHGLERVTILLAPLRQTGTLNLAADGTIVRSREVAPFFGGPNGKAPDGLRLSDVWQLPPEIVTAIAARRANRAAPAIAGRATHQNTPGRAIEIALATYEPRDAPPDSVRLTLRELAAPDAAAGRVVLERGGRAISGGALWNGLEPGLRARLYEAAQRRFDAPEPAMAFEQRGAAWQAGFEREDILWPFRPVAGHPCGIDAAGRDVLARLFYGLRTSLSFGLLLVVLSMTLGVVFGALQGYFGGAVDIVGQRLTEIWDALPFLYVMILLGAVLGRGFGLLLLVYAAFNWIGISYYIRSEFLRLRRQPFVEAALSAGLPHRSVIFNHILPNALTPVITFFPFSLVGAIGALAALDYLGFGLPPPTAGWGEMLQQAQQFRWAWWLILYPSLALFIVMLLGVFIGEGVRNACDPRPLSRLE